MSSAAAARSFLRSASVRNAVSSARLKSAPNSPLRMPNLRPLSPRNCRSQLALAGFCAETMLPLHAATASALLNSMLSVTRHGHGWAFEESHTRFVSNQLSAMMHNEGQKDLRLSLDS